MASTPLALRLLLTPLCTIVLLSPAVSRADSGVQWGKRALRIQNQIDNGAPFHNTMWVGSHNTFNAKDWDGAYKYDPNQKHKPREQMNHGVREVVFDIHWSSATTSMLLCHGTCSGSEKTFRRGLNQIRDFLDDGNRDEVIMLKIEASKGAVNNKFSKLANQLEGALGKRIYKPSHHGLTSGCQGLDPTRISKRTILDAGKNVIVLTTPVKGCPDNGGFNEWIFSGFQYQENGTSTYRKKFDKPKSPGESASMRAANPTRMQRMYDSATWYSIADGDNGTVELRKGNVAGYMAGGLNVFEMFNYNGQNASTKRPWLKPQDLVWSWATGEPNNTNGGEHCAVSGTHDRFNDRKCSEHFAFACRNAQGTWRVTTGQGPFSKGDATCRGEFGQGFYFSVPVNGQQNQTFLDVKADDTAVWLNYQDLSMEGQWIANSSRRSPYTTVASAGGSGGSSFDDKQEMKYDLYRSAPRRVTKVVIRAGKRVDRVSLTYSDGRTVSHGGSGGSDRTLTLGRGEYVHAYKRCIDKYNDTQRVFYLEFTTNKGRVVSGGRRSGSCTSGKYTGKHLFGFHGRRGTNVDALGFYFRQ